MVMTLDEYLNYMDLMKRADLPMQKNFQNYANLLLIKMYL